ncbi:MAG: hypothetical protein E6H48_03020 [Betaproteobacteria bacterium]|nr:MAG: hypothetical protein E6H48_03020 [Betaproteobacteria bacterium]
MHYCAKRNDDRREPDESKQSDRRLQRLSRCCDFDGLNDGTGWAYYSFAGRQTWHNVQLPELTAETLGKGTFKRVDSAGDPVVTFSPDGVAYYANIVFSRDTPASGVAVSTSLDGGQTWSAPNLVTYNDAGNFFSDKEWIAAGANGKVVVKWTRFNQGPHGAGYLSSPIVGAISNDYGQTRNRRGFPISDNAHPFNQGSQVQFATLYVAYEGSSPTTGYATDAMVLARSADDGRSFTTVELARVYDDFDCYPIYAGRQTLTDMHFRLNSYPAMSVDPSTGAIAIAWSDNQGSGNCGTGQARNGTGVVLGNDIESGQIDARHVAGDRCCTGRTCHYNHPGQSLSVSGCK